jgi:hypothetical protein
MMTKKWSIGLVGAVLTVVASALVIAAQDRYALKIQNGLTFAEFKGYEAWQTISVSHNGNAHAPSATIARWLAPSSQHQR